MLTAKQQEFLKSISEAAVVDEVHGGCPALLTVAQAILESGWGDHAPGGNYFGIKEYSGAYGRQQLLTTEYVKGKPASMYQWFATFATPLDCLEKHSELITRNPRYAGPFEQYAADHDIAKLIYGIAPIYATDINYANKVLGVMSMNPVLVAIGEAWRKIDSKN